MRFEVQLDLKPPQLPVPASPSRLKNPAAAERKSSMYCPPMGVLQPVAACEAPVHGLPGERVLLLQMLAGEQFEARAVGVDVVAVENGRPAVA